MAVQHDIINLVFKELFTVKFLHAGYGTARKSFIAEDISIEPDKATREIFVNHNLDYRFFNDTLICFIRTGLLSPPSPTTKIPYVKFESTVVFRFLINASNEFIRKTSVIVAGSQQVYQFTNQANAATGGFICMHTTGVNNDDLKSAAVVKADRPCFGVIDIVSAGSVNGSYELFAGGPIQELKSPAYSIQFVSTI